jgi:CO/xanthine dehydrogenase Mo-binding subunit
MEMPAPAQVSSQMAPAPHREGPYGAKGFAEKTPVPVAAAVGNALYHALGGRIKDLPDHQGKSAGSDQGPSRT